MRKELLKMVIIPTKAKSKEEKRYFISKHMPLFIKRKLRILKTTVEGNREDFQ